VGGEVLELKTELLQAQKEEGGDRRRQPAGGVRIEEDELPRDQVVRARACTDLPRKLQRGPPKEAAHRVELILALEAAGLAKRRHGGGCCGCEGKDCKDAGRGRNAGRKKQIANVQVKTKGCCGVWSRQVRKDCLSLRHMPLNKAAPPLNSSATEEKPKSRSHQAPASYPL
jgi:hypothetical protein